MTVTLPLPVYGRVADHPGPSRVRGPATRFRRRTLVASGKYALRVPVQDCRSSPVEAVSYEGEVAEVKSEIRCG